MQSFYSKLETAFSQPRLAVYQAKAPSAAGLPAPKTNLDVVGAYAHNVLVAKALLPSLHILEVTLRNSLHRAMRNAFGRADWYDAPGILGVTQQAQLAGAKSKLTQRGRVLTPDYVVAECTFGFWVGLFSGHYERPLWRNHPALIVSTFPSSPRHFRTRGQLSHMLNPLRDLRNNVMHWERVTDEPALSNMRRDAAKLVAWMSPAAAQLLEGICEFDATLNQVGQQRARNASGGGFDFHEIRCV